MRTIKTMIIARQLLPLILVIGLFSSFIPKETVWVAIGDSITYLNDHPDETGNRVQKGYLTRVAEALPGMRYVNQGHNGWKCTDIAGKIEGLGLVKADLYTIFLGTNDWWGGRPVGTLDDYKNNTGTGTTAGSFRIIIDKVRQLNPAAQIVLITPMQRGDFVYLLNPTNNAYGSYKEKNGQSLEQFANAVIAIGKAEHIPVVDLYHDKRLGLKYMTRFKRLKDPATGTYRNYRYPRYAQIPFDPKNDEYPYPPESIDMTYDGLHPSDRGNEIIAAKLVKVLKHRYL